LPDLFRIDADRFEAPHGGDDLERESPRASSSSTMSATGQRESLAASTMSVIPALAR
jgi:hypothetical protein